MAHEVESMFSARVIPWHGLGTITEGVLTAKDAIVAAGLDWAVRKEPLYAKGNSGEFFEIEDKYLVRRLSDDRILGGWLGTEYECFQNVEAFDLFDTVVDDGSAKYETAGSLRNGQIVFILARLNREITIAGDEMVPYLLLLTSHDGSTALRMLTTPVRVVCANTMRMALADHQTAWSVRHTSNMKARVSEAREALGLTWKYYDEFEAEVDRLMNQSVTNGDVDRILGKVFPKKNTDVLPEKALAVRGLYETADTIGDFRGTAWGLLNAVNEWELWTSPTRDETKRIERQARDIVSGVSTPLTRKTHDLLLAARPKD